MTTDAMQVTQADVCAAAIQWCGEKDRETSLDDIRYFEENWSALLGLRRRVEAFALHREATSATLTAQIEALTAANEAMREALEAIAAPTDFASCIGNPWDFYRDLQAVASVASKAFAGASDGGEA